MKRILALALCALLLLSMPTALAAKKSKKNIAEPEPVKIEAAYTKFEGIVRAVNTKEKSVEISGDAGSIILLMGNEPILINNKTREPEQLSSLKIGDSVVGYHINAVSADMPPRANGLGMLTQVESGAPLGIFFEVEKIGRKGNAYTLYNQPQDLIVSMDAGIRMQPFSKNAQNKISAIKPGARFVFWPDTLQEGAPPTAQASTAVMLPYTYDGYILIEQNYVNVNGYMLDTKAMTKENGTVYIPILDAAKRLDINPKYSVGEQTIILKQNGKNPAVLTIGQETFTIGKQQYQAPAPVLEERVLYVSLAAIQILGKYKVVVGA